ncbi:MAG: sulfatase [Verrucomicrobiae bacterium]|nr:sulfatase [Verrucomicrobiae bacterium]NNJ42454.1 sulfatase [Akkermansiaceae bacterium]
MLPPSSVLPTVTCIGLIFLASLATAAKKPNILIAISDDQSFPHASAYGCKWVNTPGFDQVAHQGILFSNAYTPNAKCSPSRACILTGRNSWQLEEAANHVFFFQDKFITFFEALDKNTHYAVGVTGKGLSPVMLTPNRRPTGKRWDKHKLKHRLPAISPLDYAANFEHFLNEKPQDQPFCFWYGSTEPHRKYQYQIGLEKGGKKLADIDQVPAYWPDNETVRTDMLDYAFEVEHFDSHLLRMLELLKTRGELDNTIIIVTSDNGMPFPRGKGTQYKLSNHLPLAIMWPNGIQSPGRTVTDYVSFIDLAPTLLELAGVTDPQATGMQPIQGQSLNPIFKSNQSGRIIKDRNHVLLGQERHDVGRPHDAGYPIRSIIIEGMLYIHNFKPDRWPYCNPETGYLNCDGSPTKTEVLNLRRNGHDLSFWQRCFGKRGAEELYDLRKDPDCLHNLLNNPEYASRAKQMKDRLFNALKKQNDPRMSGKGDIFDQYRYGRSDTSNTPNKYSNFYNRFIRGEATPMPTWVNPSDYEKSPVKESSH